MSESHSNFCGRTRREFLWQTGCGFAGTALTALLGQDGFLGSQSVRADGVTPFQNPLAPKQPHFDPQATACIFLFMYGGPSHIDTFDYKPEMIGRDNQTVEVKTFGRGGHKNEGRIVEPRWKFKQYGECGKWVSDLFPHLSTKVDDIAFLHSMTADSPIHGSAMLMMNSGRILSGSPCLGSWVNYGLGTMNENLPGFVVMLDPRGGPISGAKELECGGSCRPRTRRRSMRSQGEPILDLKPPEGLSMRRAAQAARHAPRLQRGSSDARVPTTPISRPASPVTNWPSRCSSMPPRRSISPRRPQPRRSSTAWTTRRRQRSAASACWPGGSSNAACGSSRSTPAAITTTPTGTPTATWNRTTTCTRGDRQADRRPAHRPQAARPARRHARRLGRRIRPAADRRVRQGNRPRPQLVRLHHVDGRRRHQGGRELRQHRRTRQHGGRGSVARQAPARHGPAPDGPRPERPDLLLRRPRSEAGRRGGCRSDRGRHRVSDEQRDADAPRRSWPNLPASVPVHGPPG